MQCKTTATSIPALKGDNGVWIKESEAKADHFACVFEAKCVMIPEESGTYPVWMIVLLNSVA